MAAAAARAAEPQTPAACAEPARNTAAEATVFGL